MLMIIFIAAADAVQNGDRLWLLTIAQRHLARRWTCGVEKPLHLERIINAGILAVTVLNQRFCIHQIKAYRNNHCSDFYINKSILLLKINGLLFADFFAQTALALKKISTGIFINNWFLRHGLWKWNIDRLSFYERFIPFGNALAGAFLRACQTGVTLAMIHITRLLFNGNIEIAHIAFYFGHFTIGKHRNVLVLQNIIHFGSENTGGTIQCRKCFIKLGHVPADG